jgi:PAS domain S-box-containing protein
MIENSSPDSAPRSEPPDGRETELLHFLLENIPVRIYFKDRKSRFIRISRAMARFHGLKSPAEAVGKTDFDLFTSEHAAPAFADEQEVMRTGQAMADKVEKETLPDGQVRWALTTKMPLRDPEGRIIGTCGITQDVTAQKNLEDALAVKNDELLAHQQELERTLLELEAAHSRVKALHQQLLEAEKMQALGRVVYGVAHEIRNPLTIFQTGLDYFASTASASQDPVQAAIVAEMRTAIKRADAVIAALMDTTAQSGLNREACDLHELIDRVLAALAPEWSRHDIKVVRDFDAEIPPLNLDRSKMEQVFDALFQNAIDAMGSGGEFLVRTRRKKLAEADIQRDAGLRSADRFRVGETIVLVEMEDTGPGIPSETLPRVYDPFFTTKETGQGIGLGLTVCRANIELHQGILLVHNRPEGGVRVSLWLKA